MKRLVGKTFVMRPVLTALSENSRLFFGLSFRSERQRGF